MEVSRVTGPDKLPPKRGLDMNSLSTRVRAAFHIVPHGCAQRSGPPINPLIPVPVELAPIDGSIGVSCNPADVSAKGLKIEQVDNEGPSAGLIKPGDRIVSVGDVDVDRSRVDSAMLALAGYIAASPRKVKLVVLREYNLDIERSRDQIVKDLEKQLVASQLDKISPTGSGNFDSQLDDCEFEQVDVAGDNDEEEENEPHSPLKLLRPQVDINHIPLHASQEIFEEVQVAYSPPERSTSI